MRRRLFLSNFMMYLAILLLPIAVLGMVIFFISLNYIESAVKSRNEVVMRQGVENMDRVLEQMEAINLNLSIQSSVARKVSAALNHPRGGIPGEDYYLVSTVVNMLLAVSSSNDFIYAIYLYVPNDYNLFIDSGNGIQDMAYHQDGDWYQSYLDAPDKRLSWFERRDIYRYAFETEPTRLLSFYQPLTSPLLQGGVLVLNVYADKIGDIFNEVTSATQMDFLLMGAQGEVLFANGTVGEYGGDMLQQVREHPDSSFTLRSSEGSFLVWKRPSAKWPEWTYVSVMDHGILYQFPKTVGRLTGVAIVACLFAGMVLAYRSTKRNVGYLEHILGIIERSENGLAVTGEDANAGAISRSDVYGYILTNIVRTFASNQTLKNQLSAKNFQIQTLEFMALRNQIRPHFLYNTLETINWMTIGLTSGPNEASNMIQNLSSILRYAFSHTLESVAIDAEVQVVHHYLAIQKARYKRFAGVAWQVDGRLRNAKILKFMIQPIVENCFQHGLGGGDHVLAIKIRIYERDGRLHIRIIDTGIGMPAEVVQRLRHRLRHAGANQGEHIGLINTNQRIRLYYGEQFGIAVRSRPRRGTVVLLTLPILYDKKDASPPRLEASQ